MTDNDKKWGPFTIARWKRCISLEACSGDDEDQESFIRAIAFGWAFRMELPQWMVPAHKVKVDANWDAASIARLGRNWYYDVTPRRFGFSLSDMGNGYDFFQLHYGLSSHDSRTDKTWSKHLPWKQWDCVRHSYYHPDGSHFFTAPGKARFSDWYEKKEECPSISFEFDDYDGQRITAVCRIEEMEWRRGTGWFKWLRFFSRPKIRRSLDIKFSAEVGSEKGSWKGGTTGHGIEMLANETPQEAFIRYCAKGHRGKYKTTPLTFIGPCPPPSSKTGPSSSTVPA
jgi:hypothetical protein